MKTLHFYITIIICGLGLIIGGYMKDQGGTMGLGLVFLLFVLICSRLTIQRR